MTEKKFGWGGVFRGMTKKEWETISEELKRSAQARKEKALKEAAEQESKRKLLKDTLNNLDGEGP